MNGRSHPASRRAKIPGDSCCESKTVFQASSPDGVVSERPLYRTGTLLLVAFVFLATAGQGQQSPSEYQVKAAFLFNFAKFIDWPTDSFASPRAAFAVCVLGKDPFGHALDDMLPSKSIGEHPVMVLRAQEVTAVRHCQIVFVSSAEAKNLRTILDQLRGTNALVVGESDGFAAAGGAIQFTVEDNHVRFLINPDAGERAGLKFSSKLLALAKIVHDSASGGKT